MKIRSHLRDCAIALILAATLLSSCAFPKIGPFGGAKATPETTQVAGQATGEATSSADPTDAAKDPASAAPAGMTELTAADFGAESDGMHDLILFTSQAAKPFPGMELGAAELPYAERALWAISPDGSRAGRISPDGFGSALQAPVKEGEKTRLVEYGSRAMNEAVESLAPPAECDHPADAQFDAENPPCGGFALSPNGLYLAYFSGPYTCGRKLTVQDLTSNQPVRSFDGARWVYWLQDNVMMLSSGSCEETGKAAMYLPQKDTYSGTGSDGAPLWNPAHTAVLFQVSLKPAARSALWGFNTLTSKVFMWQADANIMEYAAAWTPESDLYLYQHRKVRLDKASNTLVLEGPLQILSMSAKNRSQKQLAYKGAYDFHLCMDGDKPCDQWYGDWVKVTRVPFKPSQIKLDADSGKAVDTPETRCALTGQGCMTPGVEFALNWKTGELVEWENADLPAEPTSAYPSGAPNTDIEPVYRDPDGNFVISVGVDGRSLWYVPGDSDPVLWVEDGEGFVYVK